MNRKVNLSLTNQPPYQGENNNSIMGNRNANTNLAPPQNPAGIHPMFKNSV